MKLTRAGFAGRHLPAFRPPASGFRRSAAFFAWVLGLQLPATSADWPQFLGPNRDGAAHASEPAIAPAFPASGPTILWRAKVGTGFAGPAVAAGKVIAFHRVGDECRVDALEAATGREIWSFAYPTDYVDSFGFDNGPRATPTIAGDRVIVHGADGVVHALDLKTGAKLWRYDTVKELQSPQGFFGRACAPVSGVNGQIILSVGGRNPKGAAGVIALNAETGSLAWQSVSDEASYSSPVVQAGKASAWLYTWMRNQLFVCDATDGSVLFSMRHRSDMDASVNAAAPVLCGPGQLFTSSCYGVGGTLWKIETGPKSARLTQVWSGEGSLDCHYGTPVYHQGHLYGFHGRQEQGQTLRCIRIDEGKVAWESPRVPGGSLLRVRDTLVVVTEGGELWLVPARPEKFEQTAAAQILRAGHRSFPAFSDGVLFARDGKELVAVRLNAK